MFWGPPRVLADEKCRWSARRWSYQEPIDIDGGTAMWDTVQTSEIHLPHDLSCPRCGHPVHTFLACSDTCACEPTIMPGAVALVA